MLITKADRDKYKWMDNDMGIRARIMVDRIPDKMLKMVLTDSRKFEIMRKAIGKGTSPNWLGGSIVEAMYTRGLIYEDEFDRLYHPFH